MVVVSGQTVTEVDTATGAVSSVSDPRYAAVTQAVLANSQVYLLDGGSHRLDVLALDPLAALGLLAVLAGSDQLVTHDNLVFVNNDGSPAAAVVDESGKVTPITKYQVAPAAGPSTAPSALTQSVPAGSPSGAPTPAPVPVSSAYPPSAGPVTPPPAPQVTTPPVTAPSTTVPSPPGAPTISAVTAGTGTVSVAWRPGPGLSPSGYVVLVGPQAGGNTTSTSEPAAATTAVIGNLARGLAYCAQIQAVGAGANQNSQLSNKVCATTIPSAPGVPTNLSFIPDSQGVDMTFGAAPNGTTYTVSLGGTVAQSHVAAGTYHLALPVQHSPAGGIVNGSVKVQADANAGGAGGAATRAVWAYQAVPVIDCAGSNGDAYETAAVDTCATNRETVASPGYLGANNLPSLPTNEVNCTYGSLPGYFTKSAYVVKGSGGGSTACPPAPSGYAAGIAVGNGWTQPGGTPTVRVDEWEVTEPGGWIAHPVVGPGQTPEQVAGVATLTNKHIIYPYY